MKCPKCGREGCRYVVSKTKDLKEKKRLVRKRRLMPRKKKRGGGQRFMKKLEPRTDFRAKCPHCNWEGLIQ